MTSAIDQSAQRAVEGDTERDHLPAANDNVPEREPNTMSSLWADFAALAASDTAPRMGDFMQTFTGRAVYPLDLRTSDIDIRDIAHALSMQCRYAGHTQRFYSVAEHSVLVARWCRQYGPAAALEGLLHDATEAYLVDVPRPVKPFLKGYKLMEQRAAEIIGQRFGLDPRGCPECVHEADNRILNDERAALMAPCEREWGLSDARPLGVVIEGWVPARAEREFLALFAELYGED